MTELARPMDETIETLTRVPGFLVGHAHDLEAATGCTAILCPPGTRCAVDQRGGAPGTRETDLLGPGRLVRHVDAIVLTGGSAFGLAAADGAMRYLEAAGRGYRTRAGVVPIVPAAVVFDLDVGRSDVRPDAAMGQAACTAACARPVPEGSVGAGAGCRVGAVRGTSLATKGGVGSAARRVAGDLVVGALFAVNALGDVVDEDGSIIAGLRAEGAENDGSVFFGTSRWLLESRGEAGAGLLGENTVVGVVATNARLGRDGLALVAAMAQDGLARAVRPSHTLYDGDTIFALAGGEVEADATLVGALAAETAAEAIRRGVRQATSLGGVPAARDL